MGVILMKSFVISACFAICGALFTSGALASVPCVEGDYAFLPSNLAGAVKVNSRTVQISVEVPVRSHIERCVVSPLEYGDFISFRFKEGHEAIVTISGNHNSRSGDIKRKLTLKHIALHPTLLASERDIYPYFIRIRDIDAKLAYDFSLDRSGNVAKTEAYHLER